MCKYFLASDTHDSVTTENWNSFFYSHGHRNKLREYWQSHEATHNNKVEPGQQSHYGD